MGMNPRYFIDTYSIPCVWLGAWLIRPYVSAVPSNDNCWKFGTGPDALRKMIAAEKKPR